MRTHLNPRIWRSSACGFSADEALQAERVYTNHTLAGIRDQGFDSIWLRGRLYDLMASRVFPELNRPRADERIRQLQNLIRRGQETGIGVWLFFNEPLAIPSGHAFWHAHPEVRGTSHWENAVDPVWGAIDVTKPVEMTALCTSAPLEQQFFKEAVTSVLSQLPGLAGVILITASELHTHCWSHQVCRPTGDKYLSLAQHELSCPRCRTRGAAPVVLDLINTWQQAMPADGRVLAWNWSWSIWFPDPQREIVEKLPIGVELLADWERGGTRQWQGHTIPIDEYSLGYIGPSERFRGARAAAHGIPVHAKLQINTTHELATVPNLPLLPNLHAKWTGLQQEGVTGVMGCWNFGCLATLNTYAFRLFHENTARWVDPAAFLKGVAESYFGDLDVSAITTAWNRFCAAFELYPFSFGILYHSPINYAPGYPLDPHYRDQPMGPSHLQHPWGDRLEDTLGEWSLDEVIRSFESMHPLWQAGLVAYRRALEPPTTAPVRQLHRRQELICAEMIGCHLASMIQIYRFHRWRLDTMKRKGLKPPCTVPLDESARRILREEEANCQVAIPLVQEDPRLGFHEEAQAVYYDAVSLAAKHRQLLRLIGHNNRG